MKKGAGRLSELGPKGGGKDKRRRGVEQRRSGIVTFLRQSGRGKGGGGCGGRDNFVDRRRRQGRPGRFFLAA